MKPAEKKLLGVFRRLTEADRQTVFAFAEFLNGRTEPASSIIAEPIHIERNPAETIVGALKRLSKMYPMLDKAKMLDETSTLVTQHVIQGRDRAEVIDELEVVFKRHYERLVGRDSA